MGMFDDKNYLTGKNGLVSPGDSFMLYAARISGTVTINGRESDEAELEISLKSAPSERIICYTSGKGIVNQVRRVSDGELPAFVTLAERPSQHGNPTHVLEPADPAGADHPF